MKQKMIFLMLTFYVFTGLSQNVPISESKKLAINHYYKYDTQSVIEKYKDINITSCFTLSEGQDTLIYIFNIGNDKGFVIMSADRRAYPILGFSFSGTYTDKDLPPAFSELLYARKKEIKLIKDNDLTILPEISYAWEEIQHPAVRIKANSCPLLQTQWNQRCVYNMLCPADTAGSCGHTLVGCTATAYSQLLKYWSYPLHGTGSNSYTLPVYGTISADFSSATYNYDVMPNKITWGLDTIWDLARLNFHCGVALNMHYGVTGSGAMPDPDVFINNFGYAPCAQLIYKSNYTNLEWENILKEQIDSLQPVFYTGGASDPHAFVCDDYIGTNYFHFNFGWNGYCDGYYFLSALNVPNYDFTANQYAIVYLKPATGAYAFTNNATNVGCSEAILNGIVMPNSIANSVFFEFGETLNYGTTIDANPLTVSGSNKTSVNALINGLNPDTRYYYRLKVVNSNGNYFGSCFSFKTEGDWDEVYTSSTDLLNSVYFTDENIGYAVGRNTAGTVGIVKKTVDASITWTTQNSGTSNILNSVYFINSNTGFIAGDSGTILRTINGGSSWQSIATGISGHLYSVYFINSNTGFAVGGSPSPTSSTIILKTTDNGVTWTSFPNNKTRVLRSVFFVDENKGYAVGDGGIICKTEDGGSTWQFQYVGGVTNHIYSVHFTDSITGYAAGGYSTGSLYKTINGGLSWFPLSIPATATLYSIYFLNNDTGYVAGNLENLFKTVNAGTTWDYENYSSGGWNLPLRSVHFPVNHRGYVAANNYVIAFETCSGTIGIQYPEMTYNNSQILINDPIPNPTGSKARIEYVLPAGANSGEMKIIDIRGKERLCKSIHAESGIILINIDDFENGMYFYYIELPLIRSVTKKLVVVKQ